MDGYDDAKGPPRPEVQRMVGNAWSITARAIYTTADNKCTEVFMSMDVKMGTSVFAIDSLICTTIDLLRYSVRGIVPSYMSSSSSA